MANMKYKHCCLKNEYDQYLTGLARFIMYRDYSDNYYEPPKPYRMLEIYEGEVIEGK